MAEKLQVSSTATPPSGAKSSSAPSEKYSIEEGRVVADKDADAAAHFALDGNVSIDETTDKRIRHMVDWHIIPWMFGLYLLQQLDKTSLSYAAIMGIRDDLSLTTGQYAWTGSIFYIGYLVFEYPHNRAMQKFPLAKYVSYNVILWGVTLACHAACTNYAGLMVARFFLGALEGSVTAGFVLMTGRWYRAQEQALRTAFWFCANGFQQIIGGALAYGIASGFASNSSITFASWKVIFVIAGIITSLYGVGMLFFLPDSPINAKWLNDEDRHLAVERLRGNQQGIGSKVFKWYQFREALTDVRSWLYCLFCVTAMIPAGGLTVFFTLLIQGYGFDSRTSLLITMPGGLLQIIVNLGFPYLAFKINNRMLSASIAMLLSLFGIALMTGLARDGPTAHRIGQLVGYYILYGNTATAFILILSSVSTNVAGYTKKTTVNAMTLISYCVGFLIGPQTFRDGPHYTNAKYNIIAQYLVALACCMALLWINARENKRRDAAAADLPPQPVGQEFSDLTDKENKYFRYAM